MEKMITRGNKQFKVSLSGSGETWTAFEVNLKTLPSCNQSFTLPTPWSCEACSEEELFQKIDEYLKTTHNK